MSCACVMSRLLDLYDQLGEDVKRLDNLLYANILDDLKKEVVMEENRRKQDLRQDMIVKINSTNVGSYEKAMDVWIKQTMKGTKPTDLNASNTEDDSNNNFSLNNPFGAPLVDPDNNESSPFTILDPTSQRTPLSGVGLPNMIRFPNSLPALLLPIIFRSTPLQQQDIDCLKNSVFTSDIISNLTIEASPYICVFRGTPPSLAAKTTNEDSATTSQAMYEKEFQSLDEKVRNRINFFSSDTFISSFGPAFDEANLESRVKVSPGMKNRIQVFVLPEDIISAQQQQQQQMLLNGNLAPMTAPPPAVYMSEKYAGVRYNPIYVIISQSAQPRTPGGLEYAVGTAGLVASAIAAFVYSTDTYSLNKNFMDAVTAGNLDTLDKVLMLTGSILGLQLIHELGHGVAAYANKLKISWPYFIPSLQIGHFGAITNFLSFPKNRNQVFDVAISGPVAGFLASLGLLLAGLLLTSSASPAELASYPVIPTGFFSSSLLLYQLSDAYLHLTSTLISSIDAAVSSQQNTLLNAIASSSAAGTATSDILQAQAAIVSQVLSTSLTSVHPLVVTGVTGLFVNAFNFMPIGRLDGGRVFSAVFGRKSAATISTFTLIAQSLSLLVNSSPLALFWILNVVFLQRGQDIPPLDDITPVSCESGISNSLIHDDNDDRSDSIKEQTSSTASTTATGYATKKNVAYYTRLFSFAFCLLLTASMLLPMPLDLTAAVSAVSNSASGTTAGINGGLPI